jgi:hypothetical protein
MATIKVGDLEVEYGWIADRGAYYATVLIRCLKPIGDVRDIGYVFKARHATQTDDSGRRKRWRISAPSIPTITSPGRTVDSPLSNERQTRSERSA